MDIIVNLSIISKPIPKFNVITIKTIMIFCEKTWKDSLMFI